MLDAGFDYDIPSFRQGSMFRRRKKNCDRTIMSMSELNAERRTPNTERRTLTLNP
jgi:hypothetical protein